MVTIKAIRQRVAKKRKVSYQERRKAIGKQLKYLKKNLGNTEDLIQAGASLENLSKRQKNCLETIKKVYEQQQSMWRIRPRVFLKEL